MSQSAVISNRPNVEALKESIITAAIATALMVPLIGLHAKTLVTGLVIETKFADVAIAVGFIFLGRYALVLTQHARPWPAIVGGLASASFAWFVPFPAPLLQTLYVAGGAMVTVWGMTTIVRSRRLNNESESNFLQETFTLLLQRIAPWAGSALVLIAVVLPWLPFSYRGLIDIATVVLIYIILGWGLNIVVGLAGLLDLGYVAFYAAGAYSFALLFHHFGLSFWICLPIAGAFAAFIGLILGFPVLRLRGDYLAIVTLGFGEIVRILLVNWVPVTGGPNGISGIPKPSFFGLPFQRSAPEGVETFHQFFDVSYSPLHRVIFLFYVALFLALIINFFILRIRKMPIGRAWEALREDEIACRSLGLNPTKIKLSAFALGAMLGGIGGTIFATRQSFISPESFTFIESAVILAIVVLGGMGSQIGVVIAAFVLIGLPEWFREIQEYRMLAFGALMVMIMIWRPSGLLSFRVPTISFKTDRAGGKP